MVGLLRWLLLLVALRGRLMLERGMRGGGAGICESVTCTGRRMAGLQRWNGGGTPRHMARAGTGAASKASHHSIRQSRSRQEHAQKAPVAALYKRDQRPSTVLTVGMDW